ncbi:MAG: Hpt domain-containing protein [Candidatus Gastranaerophilales bacterium]|nr:Hpt domain-containing protein [Candidatus Gastranaerophilales bacterium]
MIDNVNINGLLNKILEKDEFTSSRTSNYPKLLSEFIEKTLEDLELIKIKVSILEKDPKNSEISNDILNLFFNIKGFSGFVGQNTVQQISHQTERLIDMYKDGSIIANKNIITLIHTSMYYIRRICTEMSLNKDENFTDTVFIHLKNIDDLINKEDIELSRILKDKNYIIHKINTELLLEFELELEEELKTIEDKISKLENDPNKEVLNSVLCAFHSITGLAERAGYLLIRRIAFQVEMLLESCSKGEITVNNNIIQLISKSKGYISSICNNFDLTLDPNFLNELYHYLESMKLYNFQKEIADGSEILIDKEYWQDFIAETKEHLENIELNVLILERDAQNIQILNIMFRSFHSIKGLAGFVNQNLIQEIAHKTETIMTDCIKGEITVNSNIVDLILSSADCIKQICSDITLNRNYSFLKIINEHLKLLESIQFNLINNEFDSQINVAKEEPTKKIGEILVDQNTLNTQEVQEILKKQKDEYSDLSFGQIALKEYKAKPREILNAIRKQQINKSTMTQDEFMRVPVNKIDNLVNIISDLITTQSQVEEESKNFVTSDLFNNNINKLSKIAKDIENLSIFLRIVPLKSTFQKLTRIARDTMTELNKDINFTIQGEDIDIDRNIAEKILVPLVHLVRNAIGHGIEEKEERKNANKPLQGTVKISAFCSKGKFYIKISDDGKGIDVNKIFKKASEQNLVNSEKNYSENEIINLIFLPGFSSADTVDNISGRGIGLDVVKADMEKIGGKIEIINKIGEGCTFVLELSVKNVVMNGITVDIKGSNYFIPSTFVRQILKPMEQDWIYAEHKKTMIRIEDEIIPLAYTSESGIKEHETVCELIILLEIDQNILALPINKIIERRKITMSLLEEEEIPIITDFDNLFIKELANISC